MEGMADAASSAGPEETCDPCQPKWVAHGYTEWSHRAPAWLLSAILSYADAAFVAARPVSANVASISSATWCCSAQM